LYEAVSALERHFGGAFVCAPTRWRTADGVIDYRAVYPAMDMRRRQIAEERLERASAFGLAQLSGEKGRQEWTKIQRVADGVA
jgi:hypothetical protein